MFKIKSGTRLALTIGLGCACLVWMALGLELIPNPERLQVQGRVKATKAIAIGVTGFAENKRSRELGVLITRAEEAEKDIESIGVRRKNKSRYLVQTDAHEQNWTSTAKSKPGEQISVEILANGKDWGTLEIAFVPLQKKGVAGLFSFPFSLLLFIGAAVALMSWGVLSRSFKYLNPSKVVPDRVRSALDTLAEGLALIDPTGEVAHANRAFAELVKRTDDEILGVQIGDFDWSRPEENIENEYPWTRCMREKTRVCGEIVQLKCPNTPSRKFVVNATPILGGKGTLRGVLASFDDVTAMEHKNAELAKMIHTLRNSRDEISRQNEQLNFLASYDPLTNCLNRRAFFGKFEQYWKDAVDGNLTIMMLDVDHFKAVNDNHGHSAGDEVLKAMGALLGEVVQDRGLVCRYGGEEFIVLLPDCDIDNGCLIAEEVRAAIEAAEAAGIKFTASIGVSGRVFGSMDPQHLLDQADESLYTAKRNGRNRVIRFDERVNFPEEGEQEEINTALVCRISEIPYSAVTGLLSALSFRCKETAKHSMRVADLCVGIGEDLMNKRELYRLEVSALLHDIGKIGVPDVVLHKAGELTPSEWETMRKHDSIGVEIVQSAFASTEIADVIKTHHYSYSDRTEISPETPVVSIPLAARILTVCDAFDSLTNDQCYRASVSDLDALQEIVKSTPSQFDPLVVAKLVTYVQEGRHKSIVVAAPPSTRCAIAIGQHIEDLYAAIADEDVERLQSVVDGLKRDATDTEPVSDAADRLEVAIGGQELEKVLVLAKEVMDVCRATRSTIVETAGSVITSMEVES